MNILILNYEFPPIGGGAGVFTKILANALGKRGHSIVVLTSKVKNLPFYEKEKFFEVYRVPVLGRDSSSSASMLSLLTWPIFSIPFGFWLCMKRKIDLINTHFFAPTGPTGLILSFLSGIANLIYSHGGDVYEPAKLNKTPSGKGFLAYLLRLSLKIQVRFCAGVMCQTKDMKEKIAKFVPKLKSKIKVFPLFFEKPNINSKSKKKTKSKKFFRLISIGRFIRRKDYYTLIKALEKLPEKFKLTLVGDGPQFESLKNLTIDLKVEKRVEFTGFIKIENYEKKYRKLKESDCFVLTSWYEPFGIVLQEAMFCGLPIITTDSGGPRALFSENKNALFVQKGNEKQLVRAIIRLSKDPRLQQKMSKNNLKEIKRYYTDNLIEEYESYFEKAIT